MRILIAVLMILFTYGEAVSEKPVKIKPKLRGDVRLFDNLLRVNIAHSLKQISVIIFDENIQALFEQTEIKDVEIYMNTNGGDLPTGMGIAQSIVKWKKQGFKFTVYNEGVIASSAVAIYAVCDKRITYKYSKFLVHPASWHPDENKDLNTQAMTSITSHMTDLTLNYIDLILAFTEFKEQELGNMVTSFTWFNSFHAQDNKLVDEIIPFP